LQARLLPPPPLRYQGGRVLQFDLEGSRPGQWNMMQVGPCCSLLLPAEWTDGRSSLRPTRPPARR
jgi:hypothetical protein